MVPNYQIYGQGFPVVLLHGFCEDLSMWEHWKKHFSNCSLVRIDLPGFGKTPIDKNYSITDMAEAVVNALDFAGIQQCVLIGHSMGGYVSLAFAERYPDRLLGLGLFHSHPFADSLETKEARMKRKNFVEQNGSAAYIQQVIPGLFAPKSITANDKVINRLIKRAEQYPDVGIINALQAMHDRPDRSSVLKGLEVPVAFIVGKKDQAVPMKYSLAQLGLPSLSTIHILEDIGHMGMFEASETCLGHIKAFIKLCRL